MVAAVGHADGDFDPVVGRLEPGVGVAQLDGPEDVGPAPANLPGEFRDLGDASDLLRQFEVVPFSWTVIRGGNGTTSHCGKTLPNPPNKH